MKTIHLLLGTFERRISNLIEVAVRDVCYGHAIVNSFRTDRLDEFIQRGTIEEFDILILTPEHIFPGRSRKPSKNMSEDAAIAIQSIKKNRQVPIIAVAVPAEHELRLLVAGADNVFSLLFNQDALKTEVRRVLALAEPISVAEEPNAPRRSSFVGFLAKGWERFRQGSKAETA